MSLAGWIILAVVALIGLVGWLMWYIDMKIEKVTKSEEYVHYTKMGGTIVYIHDIKRKVGIWLFVGKMKAGMAVLPDSEYKMTADIGISYLEIYGEPLPVAIKEAKK